MTEDQAREVFRTLLTAFPHVHDYVDGLENPEETLRLWRMMIVEIDHETARIAMGMWLKGRLQVPTARWELGIFPQNFRGVCRKIDDQRRAAQREDQLAAMTRERAAVGGADNLAGLTRLSMFAGTLKRCGWITAEENREIVEDLGRQARNREAAIRVPRRLYEAAMEYRTAVLGHGETEKAALKLIARLADREQLTSGVA